MAFSCLLRCGREAPRRRGDPTEQQPGQPPGRSGGIWTLAVRPAGPPCLQQQAVSLAGTPRIVPAGPYEVLVDGHGLLPAAPSVRGGGLTSNGTASGVTVRGSETAGLPPLAVPMQVAVKCAASGPGVRHRLIRGRA